jgi:DNA polymerase III subunit delta
MIIFLHGSDSYRLYQKRAELEAKFLRDVDASGINSTQLDAKNTSIDALWSAMATQSFLSPKRCVVVTGLADASDEQRDDIAGLLERIPDDVIAIFVAHTSKKKRSRKKTSPAPKRKKNWIATFSKAADYVQECATLEGAMLTQWTQAAVSEAHATIDARALEELVRTVGGDLWRMRSEIEKLALSGSGTITTALVRELVITSPEDDIFAFVDALGRGDTAAALSELRRLESTGQNPHYLVTMIARQVRLLTMAADCLARGTPESQLSRELSVHPFVARKLGAQARNVRVRHLCALFPQLMDLDQKLKSSRAPWEALIEMFCMDAMKR